MFENLKKVSSLTKGGSECAKRFKNVLSSCCHCEVDVSEYIRIHQVTKDTFRCTWIHLNSEYSQIHLHISEYTQIQMDATDTTSAYTTLHF